MTAPPVARPPVVRRLSFPESGRHGRSLPLRAALDDRVGRITSDPALSRAFPWGLLFFRFPGILAEDEAEKPVCMAKQAVWEETGVEGEQVARTAGPV